MICLSNSYAQFVDPHDSIKNIPEITLIGNGSKSDIQLMPEIVGTSIYAGKKSSLIVMENVQGNIANNTMRQIVAKVPGIQIWESDASGIQVGIAARGLSPNRSWEFNVRQNGYDIAADPFGYPEAYYNPPMQAVQRMEIVRGQGSLQYGPQFGGMVNYILRNGSHFNKPFVFETNQTFGSNNLINSYTAIGGETKKFHYYLFYDQRSGDGWRDNSAFRTKTLFGTFTWKVNTKLSVTAEFLSYRMRSQQAGGLTDSLFKVNARQSFRSRNWFDLSWTTAALIANYRFNEFHKLNVKAFYMYGDRSSVGFLKSITTPDVILSSTNQFDNRLVDIDQYTNYGIEIRDLLTYRLFGRRHIFSGGIRAYQGGTQRYKDGKGTTGSDFDITRVDGKWPRDIQYDSRNYAVFAENSFQIGKRLLVIPGVRLETLEGIATGRNGYDNQGNPVILQNVKRGRTFLLAGIGIEYHASKGTEFYANITQAYRPMQFADLTAPPTTDVVDPNLKDAKGYNADIGYRGVIGEYLIFDASVYYLQYNNRIGTVTQQRPDSSFYNLRTNIGNSTSKGFELFTEWNPIKQFVGKNAWVDASLFVSYAFNDAQYADYSIVTKNSRNELVTTSYKGKLVENAPRNIVRGGITVRAHQFALTLQTSHVGEAYADASNTEKPTANGQTGLIPSYTVTDLTLTFKAGENYHFKAGINNLSDERYFTRRAGGYPGPGILPADGRTLWFSVGAKF